MAGCLLAGDDVDEEVKHVGLGERGSNVRPLQRPPLVLLCVDPCAHRELGDEDVAPLGEEDGRFGRDHLDVWVCLHDLLDARQWQLMDLVVVVFVLESLDRVLPVVDQRVAVCAIQALADLGRLVRMVLAPNIAKLERVYIRPSASI